MNVGQATPYVEAFSMAKAAAGIIFAVIDRKPVIDSLSEEGMKKLFGKLKPRKISCPFQNLFGIEILFTTEFYVHNFVSTYCNLQI